MARTVQGLKMVMLRGSVVHSQREKSEACFKNKKDWGPRVSSPLISGRQMSQEGYILRPPIVDSESGRKG